MRFMVVTASTGYLPAARLRRKHHRIGAVVDRGGDVGDFGAGRNRAIDHRFEHLRRHHDRLAVAARASTMHFCNAGTSSSGISTPRSPRATITRVGQLQNVLQPFASPPASRSWRADWPSAVILRASAMSSGRCTNDSPIQSHAGPARRRDRPGPSRSSRSTEGPCPARSALVVGNRAADLDLA